MGKSKKSSPTGSNPVELEVKEVDESPVVSAEKAEADRLAAEKAEAERIAAENAAAQRANEEQAKARLAQERYVAEMRRRELARRQAQRNRFSMF